MFTEGTSMSKEKNKELALSLEMMEVFYGVNTIEGTIMQSLRRRPVMAFYIGANPRIIYQMDM